MSANVTILQAVYAAINRADVGGILSLQADDVEWRGPSAFPDLAGPHRGHEGVRAYAEHVSDAWREFTILAERFIDFGEQVLVLTRERGRGRLSGVEVRSQPTAHLWTLRDGQVVRFQVFWEREDGLRATGLSRAASPARP
jgi:ketosteroid isomerase-like protein